VFANHKHKKIPHHHLLFHVTIFSQQTNPQTNLLSQTSSISLCHRLSPWQKKGKRGFIFSTAELEHMLNIINEIVPIGNPDWEKVWQEHLATYPTMERTLELLSRTCSQKNPTGDTNFPPYVCKAKQISRKIVIATNGSIGGSSMAAESTGSDE
jgi:hypothetical protein